ncbi:hypothetical protein [Devosia lacusdianchii]|uniref:hypothetical protein n=1 Tax=Devosia lacusdianchii TaxID=2917991 RepID=UPI001F069123|nr:hypothetical protein [Devosia sp. JXJ CY 41]
MSRVPNTESLAFLFGGDIQAPTYADLSEAEIDRLIIKCRRAIASHRRDSLSRNVDTAETALVAIDDVKAVLRNLLAISPIEKRAKIEALIEKG